MLSAGWPSEGFGVREAAAAARTPSPTSQEASPAVSTRRTHLSLASVFRDGVVAGTGCRWA